MNLPASRDVAGLGTAPVYRFLGVVVDVGRQQLWVDEAEVACQPLAFRLLVMLCEARGVLVTRADLFERLWPGGQDIGDTALTQLIWRLRGALGPHADAIRTVRRGGIRLDAPVRADPLPAPPPVPESAAEPAPEAAPASTPVLAPPAAAAPVAGAPAAPGRRRRWALGAVLLAVAVAGVAFVLARRDPLISSDYELYATDVDASRPETVDLLRLAFAAERTADVGRAKQLFEQAAALDPQSPVAPAILATHSFGDPGRRAAWVAQAQQRVRDATPTYTRLLVKLATHYREAGDAIRQIEDAMLDLRPNAWRVHLALAHQHLAQREFTLALQQFRRVPTSEPGPGVLYYTLSDRASLGDVDAVETELAGGTLRNDPTLEAYVRARIAYTRGDMRRAEEAVDRAAALAADNRAYDIAVDLAELGAVAAYVGGLPDATARFERVLARCNSLHAVCEAQTHGFLAALAQDAGDTALARAHLERGWAAANDNWMRPALQLVALQRGLPTLGPTADVAQAFGPDRDYAGNAELLRAWQDYADGDRDGARRRLDRARAEGVGNTYFAEHAQLLAARLGDTVPPCTVDPPYPNLLRTTACVELARMRRAPTAGQSAK